METENGIVASEWIDPGRLHEMMRDSNWHVRLQVAQRIDPSRLHEIMGVKDWYIRYWVATRIPSKYLGGMLMRETVLEILEIIRERLNTPEG